MIAATDPTKVFFVNGSTRQLYTGFITAGVASDQQIIAAISGQRIRVMGWTANAIGATVGTYLFKSASTGTARTAAITSPSTALALQQLFPITASGYFETNTGEGLFVDVATAAVNITVFYISYTP